MRIPTMPIAHSELMEITISEIWSEASRAADMNRHLVAGDRHQSSSAARTVKELC
jgi:hypothetical protein